MCAKLYDIFCNTVCSVVLCLAKRESLEEELEMHSEAVINQRISRTMGCHGGVGFLEYR